MQFYSYGVIVDMWISLQSSSFISISKHGVSHDNLFDSQVILRIRNVVYPITLSVLLITLLLLIQSSSISPFIFQLFLVTFFFLFRIGVGESAHQFEVWMYFILATILPLTLFIFSSFSLLTTDPLRFLLQMVILLSAPWAVFLGLLSSRYFVWMRHFLCILSFVEIDMNRLQVLKVIFGLVLIQTLLLCQFVLLNVPLLSHICITLSILCLLFPILSHLLSFTG